MSEKGSLIVPPQKAFRNTGMQVDRRPFEPYSTKVCALQLALNVHTISPWYLREVATIEWMDS